MRTGQDGAFTVSVSPQEERDLIVRALVLHGAPDTSASAQAGLLVEADLRGQSSHGIRRLPLLVRRMQRGLIRPASEGRDRWVSPSVLVVDGDRGFGPVVGLRVMQALIEAAEKIGLALACVRNTNHLGMLAPYVEEAAKRGAIGIALTTSEALVHPEGGRIAKLGTNPLAVGVPAEPDPLVLDMATGVVSMGRILHHLESASPWRLAGPLTAGATPRWMPPQLPRAPSLPSADRRATPSVSPSSS